MISQKAAKSRTNLFLRGMPVGLVRRAKAAAALRNVSVSRLVEESLESALRARPGPKRSADRVPAAIRAAENWFAAHRQSLERYRGEYLAITEDGLVDHDSDLQRLTDRVWAKVGHRPLLTPKIGEPPLQRLRSPRKIR